MTATRDERLVTLVLYLLADTTIPYGFVVGAMNRIRQAGVTNVGMVTNPELLTTGAPPPTE